MATKESNIDIKHINQKRIDDIRALANIGEQNTYNNEIAREDLSVLFSQIMDIAVGTDDHLGELTVSITEQNQPAQPLAQLKGLKPDTVVKH